jgi:hypothetical protein
MNTHNRITVAAGILLCGLSSQWSQAGSFGPSTTFAVTSNGFLTKAERRSSDVDPNRDSGGLIDTLCARTARDSGACPPSAKGDGANATTDLSAGLPHLRLDIVLKHMQNVVVAGSGVSSLGLLQEPWATFKIESTTADATVPGKADNPYGLPVPLAGEAWDVPHANLLFQGIIENGCLGPATFDLSLDSTVYRPSTGEVFGNVHLTDSVEGHGYYNFKYTIRATDESGNVSDFVFSGDANAYCSGQLGLVSAATEEPGLSAKTTTVESMRASVQDSDLLTQEDIDRSPGGYKLFVPGVGDVFVKELRAPDAGKTCSIHKPSLIKSIAANPPLHGPQWHQLSIHYYFDFNYNPPRKVTICLWPEGGGCYILVSN